ncbi:putative amidohydrolase [Klebsiella pneumoniae subsp. rhinoscleromatis]|nr:putative amidohydrolase [Klebsiella pneumoniae subsp. rhinoscleromatis]
MSSNAQVRRRAVQAARGESPFDLLLIDAQIVDYGHGRNSPR